MRVFRQCLTASAAVALAAGVAAGCTDFLGGSGSIRTVTGTVEYLEFEGGFYAIEASDGVTYDPHDLPAQYRQDGLAVRATLRIRDDLTGFHQVGPIVDVLRIERR